jgi:hypothetical protein
VTDVVLVVALLLLPSGSDSFPEALAVLLIFPAELGVTTMVIAALPPIPRFPILHVTVPPISEQLPCVEEEETYETSVGKESATVTPVAPSGPLLVTVIV